MAKEKKQIEVIDMGGAKTVAKKKSLVRGVRRGIAIFTIIWFALQWSDKYIQRIRSDRVCEELWTEVHNIV